MFCKKAPNSPPKSNTTPGILLSLPTPTIARIPRKGRFLILGIRGAAFNKSPARGTLGNEPPLHRLLLHSSQATCLCKPHGTRACSPSASRLPPLAPQQWPCFLFLVTLDHCCFLAYHGLLLETTLAAQPAVQLLDRVKQEALSETWDFAV
jgi:hypothetical protein